MPFGFVLSRRGIYFADTDGVFISFAKCFEAYQAALVNQKVDCMVNAKPLVFEEQMKIRKRRKKSGDAGAIATAGRT